MAHKWKPNATELSVYNHYMEGSTRGDLYVHVKRGKIGVMKPHRSEGHCFAAWMAGQDLANQIPEEG